MPTIKPGGAKNQGRPPSPRGGSPWTNAQNLSTTLIYSWIALIAVDMAANVYLRLSKEFADE